MESPEHFTCGINQVRHGGSLDTVISSWRHCEKCYRYMSQSKPFQSIFALRDEELMCDQKGEGRVSSAPDVAPQESDASGTKLSSRIPGRPSLLRRRSLDLASLVPFRPTSFPLVMRPIPCQFKRYSCHRYAQDPRFRISAGRWVEVVSGRSATCDGYSLMSPPCPFPMRGFEGTPIDLSWLLQHFI